MIASVRPRDLGQVRVNVLTGGWFNSQRGGNKAYDERDKKSNWVSHVGGGESTCERVVVLYMAAPNSAVPIIGTDAVDAQS